MPALGGCSGAGILIVKVMFLDFDGQNTRARRGIQIYSNTVFVRFTCPRAGKSAVTRPGTGKIPANSSYGGYCLIQWSFHSKNRSNIDLINPGLQLMYIDKPLSA